MRDVFVFIMISVCLVIKPYLYESMVLKYARSLESRSSVYLVI